MVTTSPSSPTPTPAPATITMADVALAAEVATSTVSRALTNPDRVNARTRERILSAARNLGYPIPDTRRRSDRLSVAVVVPDITNPFYFDLIRGTQHQLRAQGYTQLLVDTEESRTIESDCLNSLVGAVDGVILAASRLDDQQLNDFASQVPLVTINRDAPGVSTVLVDTPGGMQLAVEHLVSLGHQRIAYAGGPPNSWSSARRWDAIVRQCTAHGIEPITLGSFPPTKESGTGAAAAVLNTNATACITFNDLIAIGMVQHLRHRGINVPEQLSVVGCDDIFGADFCQPPLTTLTSPVERAGRTAVTLLTSNLHQDAPPPGNHILSTHLTVRHSTGPAPREGQ